MFITGRDAEKERSAMSTMKKEGVDMKKRKIRTKQKDYPTLYFHAPDMLLKEPAYKKAYVEAFLKPDHGTTVQYCENTTAYD